MSACQERGDISGLSAALLGAAHIYVSWHTRKCGNIPRLSLDRLEWEQYMSADPLEAG